MVHVEPSGVTMPANSTLTGEVVAPAVVSSGTRMSLPKADVDVPLSAIAPGKLAAGRITNGTGLESASGVPGFCISTESEPAAATSEGCRVMVQRLSVGQFVVRGELLMRSCDMPLLVEAMKLSP